MTGETSMTVEGASELDASIDSATARLEDMSDAESEAGRIIASRASSLAPKLSGALAGSIRADVTENEVAVSASVNYAGIQEYGLPSHNIAAQPYMRPAMADSQSQVIEAYAKQVRTEVASIHGT